MTGMSSVSLCSAFARSGCAGLFSRAVIALAAICFGCMFSGPVTAEPSVKPTLNPASLDVPAACRRREGGSIVGGAQASIRNWPGLVALRAKNTRGDILYFCGGTLIAPSLVLTAAHCVDKLQRDGAGHWQYPERGVTEIVFDTDNLKTVQDDHVRSIATRVMHPQWTGAPEDGNDIALLRLSKPWRGFQARLANSGSADAVTQAYAAGFGLLADRDVGGDTIKWTYAGGTAEAGSPLLREVSLPIVNAATCSRTYPGLSPTGQLCAGYDIGQKDSCYGDSGGPLNAVDTEGCPYQLGIVSYGEGCAKQQGYGVYTRLSAFLPWLREQAPELRTAAQPIIPESAGIASSKALDVLVAQLQGGRRKCTG
jgi:secreted trypsin-like serine protease